MPNQRVNFVLAAIALSGFLAAELAALFYGTLDHVWTPFAVGDVVLVVGGLEAARSIWRRRPLEHALWRGGVISGLLYGGFLVITVGMIAANIYAVQLPGKIGPVYRYDPRDGEPDRAVVGTHPEATVVAHLERERTFPIEIKPIFDISGGTDRLTFGPGTTLHRVASYEVGPVLIRRMPNEVWWDDDPTFVASIDLHIEFITGEEQDFRVEMVSGCSERCDPLGLFAQGYLTPTFWSWRPNVLRPR
ncbi:MAG: hypothetical protein AB1566_07365 [Chloroflexota bacterium]